MHITHRDIKLIAVFSLVIFMAPLLTNYLLKSYSNTYTDETIRIFKQLNPSFKKLVNSNNDSFECVTTIEKILEK